MEAVKVFPFMIFNKLLRFLSEIEINNLIGVTSQIN